MDSQALETKAQDFLFSKQDNKVLAGETMTPATGNGHVSLGWEYPADTYNRLKKFAEQLKKRETNSEIFLHRLLKEKDFNFNSQFVFPPYILDFYLPQHGIAIEVDGGIHSKSFKIEKDGQKEKHLTNFKVIILRFPAEYITPKNYPEILNQINQTIASRFGFDRSEIMRYLQDCQVLNEKVFLKRFKRRLAIELSRNIGAYLFKRNQYFPGMNWRNRYKYSRKKGWSLKTVNLENGGVK